MSTELFQIEKGIDIPDRQDHSARTKYPFKEMEVGDSFFIPDVSKKFSIYACLRQFNAFHATKIQVTQRRELNGVRVWRIV